MLTSLRNFFDINVELVLFAYGLVFFILGLAIALQSRQRSRLSLARSLGWLSLFGILHGIHEWGDIFIPIQATYMNHAGVAVLQVIQVGLLGISFYALFYFGVDLVRERWPRLPIMAHGALLIWLILIAANALLQSPGVGLWQQDASIWARYLLGLPGALLAAFGLRYQALHQIRPLGLARIFRTLEIAGLAFVAYAFFAGLIVPYGSFFPASWLNQSVLVTAVGVPAPVFRSLIGLILVITIVRAMEVFDVETDRQIEQIQTEQTVLAERERIGRELHDGALQMVYSAGLIVESARRNVPEDSTAGQRMDRALTALNEAIASLRTYMSGLRAAPSSMSLVEGLQQQVTHSRLAALMDVHLLLDLPPEASLNQTQTSHVLAIVSEALSNAARHGEAEHVTVQVGSENGRFVLQVRDDGSGFNSSNGDSGYGLRNMRDRARLLGGKLTVDTAPGQGTVVTLSVPWETM